MTHDIDRINARLNALEAEFQKHLPERLQTIQQLLSVIQPNSADPTSLEALHFALHKLAGSGATFGYSALSTLARQWENDVRLLISGKTPPTSQKCDEMQRLFERLLKAATIPDEN